MRDSITILLVLVAGALFSSAPLTAQFVINPYAFPSGGGGGPTYLLQEDCEGAGKPAGWTDAASFPPDWDETVLAIEGDESVECPTSSYFSDSPTWAATSPCYLFFRLRVGANSGNVIIFELKNSGSRIANFDYRNTEVVFRCSHGSANSSATADLGSAGIYNVWLDYTAGTGADGVLEMRVTSGADLTRPASPTVAAITTGTSTGGVDQIRIAGQPNGLVYDRLRVDDTVIGSNPP